MADISLPLQSRISWQVQGETEFKTKITQFGNGYSQGAADGINNVRQSWTIGYQQLSEADHDTFVSALNSTDGTGLITWTPPGQATALTFRADSYSVLPSSSGAYDVSLTLKQAF